MPRFLSPEWVSSLDRAARDSSRLAESVNHGTIVLEQRVSMPDGSEHAHHIVISGTGACVVAGRSQHPDVVLHADLATACELAQGTINAQHALAAGRLRVGGDIDVLLRHSDALRALDDVFATVRTTTTFPRPTDGR